MKKFRVVVSVVLSIAFLLGITLLGDVPADAAVTNNSTYVALGDSITTGFGLSSFKPNDVKNKASVNNFVNKLSKRLGKKAVNFAVEGLDSTRLLEAITKPTTAEQKALITQIKKASVITLSIGGNNVLQPLIAEVNGRMSEGKTIYNASEQEIQAAIVGLIFNQTAMDKLQATAQEGASKFTGEAKLKKPGDFANIINTLKKLNPKAQIIVQTIYNPYKFSFVDFFDTVIKSMNEKIVKDSANGKNFKVADVYSAFSKASLDTVLVNSDSGKSFDPHPTAKGHEVIYTVIASAAQNNILPYKVKATITKGKLTAKVTEGELFFHITPTKGYKVPKSISLTIGKGTRKALTLNNGKASVPIADVGVDIVVVGVCTK